MKSRNTITGPRDFEAVAFDDVSAITFFPLMSNFQLRLRRVLAGAGSAPSDVGRVSTLTFAEWYCFPSRGTAFAVGVLLKTGRKFGGEV
jgi:hypothetical protein